MKKTIRLTESDLHRIVKESVKRCLNEANVVGGTNYWRDTSKSADEWDEYSDYEGGKSENLMVPDFVQTWADRFEKILNDKFFQKFPNAKPTIPSIREYNNVFYVDAHLDNDYNYDHSLFSGHSTTTRKIVLNVSSDIYMYNNKINVPIERLRNICVQLISKYATLMFGSIPGVQVMVNSNEDTKYNGSMDVCLEIEERTNYERGRYGDLEATGEPTNSRLFKNNPSRQISKQGSTFKSEEDD